MAKYVSVGGKAKGEEGQTARGDHVVVHLRSDGSAENVEAEGEVTLTNGAGGSVVAPRGRNDFECAKSAGVGCDDGWGEVWPGRSAAAGEGCGRQMAGRDSTAKDAWSI